MVPKVEDQLRYRGPRARDSGREAEETEPRRQANCDGTIIRLLRVLELPRGGLVDARRVGQRHRLDLADQLLVGFPRCNCSVGP